MNWSRIKTIFILAFLILNSFLGYQLWEKQTKKIEMAQVYESSMDELLLLKHITLATELSVEQTQMSQLNTQFAIYSLQELYHVSKQNILIENEQLHAQLMEPYPLAEPFDPYLFQQNFMKGHVLNGEQYVFDRKTPTEIVYLQKIQDYPIFLSTVKFSIEDQRVVEYKQVYHEVVNKGTEQPVISSFTTIRALLDHQVIPPNSTIQRVTLGYYGQIYEIESQVLTPVWRVLIEHEGKQITYYVNAFTGALESVPLEQ
ncbi:two-component system regulatory protein YycI [Caldalkalibacillus mannanilyticus]|uniref:two-component system regulatory protein YycI n=1 Tax=Caldalkalibacillus mannanilyticus TaxID=1418 RepID=UPI00046A94BA|nr:two-component system regulatory protein YycI [Caldalkalibacillus mannanilyticus]